MSERNALRELLTSESLSVGTFVKGTSSLLVESLGTTGLDFIVLDRQHSALDIETIEQLVRAADVYDLQVIVRLAHSRSVEVNNVLDAGASGLMIPQVEDVAAVERVVKQSRYTDGRSLSLGTRAADFGRQSMDEYVNSNDESCTVIPMIESERALDAVDDIAAMDSVPALMIGETDLAFSLGERIGSDRMNEAIDQVIEAAHGHNCGVGIFTSSTDPFQGNESMTYVVCGSDVSILTSAYDALFPDD